MAKFGELTRNQEEDILSKLESSCGGNGIFRFQNNELVLVETTALNPCWLRISDQRLIVNMAADPKPPFGGAIVESNTGLNLAFIEKRGDDLYLSVYNDESFRKIEFFLSENQVKGELIIGYGLREKLAGLPVLNANVEEALSANPDFFPEKWKKDDEGNTLNVFFWGTIFRSAEGRLFVRYVCFLDGRWRRGYDWLVDRWNLRSPAGVLAGPSV